ncbi:MAG: radical SAM protein [Candidatus Micrarchaeota archaeon]|nr:radical SAM protein [Candidatus Micrarchaeota archaeon]
MYANNRDNAITDFLNKYLELIILPTEACNFRCDYCFEDHATDGGIRPDVVLGIKNLITKRAQDLERVTVQWYGGEPLLRYDAITDIMGHLQGLVNASGGRLSASGTATTNGYFLTAERLACLVKLGVTDYQITLDGNREEHDKLRKRADDAGTFNTIWRNLVAAHDTGLDFSIMVRLHVNRDNEKSMGSLLHRLYHDMGNDKRFTVYIRQLSRLGGPNDASLPITDSLDSVNRLRGLARSLGFGFPDIDVHEADPKYVCYAAKPFSYMIRPDGRIGKCTVALRSEQNTIGRINPDGTMEIDSDKAAWWSRAIFTGERKALICPSQDLELVEPPKLLRIASVSESAMKRGDTAVSAALSKSF